MADQTNVMEQTAAPSEAPSGEQKEEQRKRRRALPPRWKKVIIVGLVALLAALVGLSIFYFTTRRPLNDLPGVRALTRKTPPRYAFSIYGAARPAGVAISPDNQRLYVAETDQERRVRVYDRNAVLQGDLMPPLSDPLERLPVQVAVAFNGQVYVSDSALLNVRVYGPDGAYVGELPKPNVGAGYIPLGVSFDRRGQLLVTSASAGQKAQVYVFDQQGQLRLNFGELGSGSGQLDGANQAVADDTGRIFVANSLNSRVEVFRPDGTPMPDYMAGKSVAPLGLPITLAIDDQSRLYVVDAVNHGVTVYDIGGDRAEFLFKFGESGSGDGQFRYPMSVAVDGTGRVYVSDKNNDRVQVWTY